MSMTAQRISLGKSAVPRAIPKDSEADFTGVPKIEVTY